MKDLLNVMATLRMKPKTAPQNTYDDLVSQNLQITDEQLKTLRENTPGKFMRKSFIEEALTAAEHNLMRMRNLTPEIVFLNAHTGHGHYLQTHSTADTDIDTLWSTSTDIKAQLRFDIDWYGSKTEPLSMTEKYIVKPYDTTLDWHNPRNYIVPHKYQDFLTFNKSLNSRNSFAITILDDNDEPLDNNAEMVLHVYDKLRDMLIESQELVRKLIVGYLNLLKDTTEIMQSKTEGAWYLFNAINLDRVRAGRFVKIPNMGVGNWIHENSELKVEESLNLFYHDLFITLEEKGLLIPEMTNTDFSTAYRDVAVVVYLSLAHKHLSQKTDDTIAS